MPRPRVRSSDLTVWPLSTPELAEAIQHTLGRLSPARAGLVTDQLHGLLQSQAADRLITLAAGPAAVSRDPTPAADAKPPLRDCLLAIAILPEAGDSATILHVDWVDPGRAAEKRFFAAGQTSATVGATTSGETGQGNHDLADPGELFADLIWQFIAARFRDAGVRFVQWATDPDRNHDSSTQSENPHPPPVSRWPVLLGFSRIGTLDYLALDADANGDWPRTGEGVTAGSQPCSLALQPLDHNAADQVKRFEAIVEQTYADSLDCPTLEKFRSVTEILAGYRAAEAYSPGLWYTVALDRASSIDSEPVGCLILSRHPGPANDESDQVRAAAIVELVYMGILPEYRGRGYGAQVMRLLGDVCQQQHAQRLILAVDRDNLPAIDAYRGFGMTPLFRESVWARSISSGEFPSQR